MKTNKGKPTIGLQFLFTQHEVLLPFHLVLLNNKSQSWSISKCWSFPRTSHKQWQSGYSTNTGCFHSCAGVLAARWWELSQVALFPVQSRSVLFILSKNRSIEGTKKNTLLKMVELCQILVPCTQVLRCKSISKHLGSWSPSCRRQVYWMMAAHVNTGRRASASSKSAMDFFHLLHVNQWHQ